jgi:hypothetical protein
MRLAVRMAAGKQAYEAGSVAGQVADRQDGVNL